MRRMFSKNQLKDLIEEYGLTEEDVIEMLVGKYVRIMEVPTSTTLNDDQFQEIIEGAFMEGKFLGFVNPVFYPATDYGDFYEGSLIGELEIGGFKIARYILYKNTKIITANNDAQISVKGSVTEIYGKNGLKIQNKDYPSYPSSTGTFTLKCVNGTLTWVEEA